MRRRPGYWLLLFAALVALVAAALWRLPSGWALAGARDALPDLRWDEARGTAWHGTVEGLSWRGVRLGRLEWRLEAFELSGGGVSRWTVRGNSPQHELSLRVVTGPGGALTLRDLRGHFPATWIDLSAFAPLLYAEGRVTLDIELLSLRRRVPVDARGELTWTGAALSGHGGVDLGEVRFRASPPADGSGAGFDIVLSESGSPDLRLAGQGRVRGDRFQGELVLDPAAQRQDLREALAPFGQVREGGNITVRFEGRLRP